MGGWLGPSVVGSVGGGWFGSDTYNIQPDIITMAKGITSGYVPLSGIMIGKRVSDVIINEGGEFYHGYTYSGHPVACAVAIENLKIIKEESLIEKSRDTSIYLQESMKEVFSKVAESHPNSPLADRFGDNRTIVKKKVEGVGRKHGLVKDGGQVVPKLGNTYKTT